eukprot:8848396-Pyramimonas_sp.AAC.1
MQCTSFSEQGFCMSGKPTGWWSLKGTLRVVKRKLVGPSGEWNWDGIVYCSIAEAFWVFSGAPTSPLPPLFTCFHEAYL